MRHSLRIIAVGLAICVGLAAGGLAAEQTLEIAHEHDEHGDSVQYVEYDGDAAVVWSLDESGGFVGYDPGDEEIVASEDFGGAHGLAVGDGVVYVAARDTIWAYDADQAESTEVATLEHHPSDIAYDGARNLIWVASAHEVRAYDIEDGSLVDSHDAHADGPHRIAVEGDHVATSGGFEPEAIVYDAAAEAVALEPDLPGDVTAVDGIHLTDGGEVIVGTDAEGESPVLMYDVETGEAIAEYREHIFGVPGIGYDERSGLIVSAGVDNAITLYDVESGSVVDRYEHADTIYAAHFDADGEMLWFGDGEERVGTVVGLDLSQETDDSDDGAEADGEDDADGSPGFGVVGTVASVLLAAALLAARRVD